MTTPDISADLIHTSGISVEDSSRQGDFEPKLITGHGATESALGPPLLTANQVADFLGVSVRLLYRWHEEGTGPRATKIGRLTRYFAVDVVDWIEVSNKRG